jgi:Fic-DOC domain mobile mystery protein B
MPRLPGDDATGATPLTDEDLDGLIPTFISNRGDLNLAEQANIEAARRWAFRGAPVTSPSELFRVSFANRIHRRMFGDVWRWAGKRRTRETNIGVEPTQIVTETKLVLDDGAYWHVHETYAASERAVRIHHRLVSVHPYRNGNGRHARFLADLYLHSIGEPRLTWGGRNLVADSEIREAYTTALRAADRGEIDQLVAFAKSR